MLVRGFMPAPYVFCMMIEQVLSEEPLLSKIKFGNQSNKMEFDKLLIQEKEEMLEKIYTIKGPASQKGMVRCGYAPKPRRRRRKS